MECIIFSDTHGNYQLAIEALSQSAPVDMIFHLGDEAEDAGMIEHICMTKVHKVAGNCDAPGKYPRENIILIGKTRVLMTHGDRYNVKKGLSGLIARAVDADVDVVLYGHTHNASIDEINGIIFINPGSLQRGSSCQSYARLTLDDSGANARLIFMEN